MPALRWIAAAVFVAAIPVFLVLTNVRIAASEPRVYGYSFSQYDVPAVTGVDRTQLDYAARDIVRYFGDGRPLLTTRVRVGEEEQPLFSPKEALHMRDVKSLFRSVFLLHDIAFVYIVGYVASVYLWSRERSLARLAYQCLLAGVLTAMALSAAALAAFVDFDNLFRQFHLVSFANDFWLLDPARDRLVQMFPRDFWFAVTLAVGLATMVEGALLALAGYTLRAWLDRKRAVLPAGTSRTPAPGRV